MRIWSIHPKYLDSRGLLALWRETLLAQKVLAGDTKGYRNHPQLLRFRSCVDPVGAAATYLREIAKEAASRGYRFNSTKILTPWEGTLSVTQGQMAYEWNHLRCKVALRDRPWMERITTVEMPDPHPLFYVVSGGVESWEKRAG